jgi:L-methionine (R)-S-oxide reductase
LIDDNFTLKRKQPIRIKHKMGFHAELSNQFSSSNQELTKEEKAETLEILVESYKALSADTKNLISNLANASSLLWFCYKGMNINVNWTGFYILDSADDKKLVLAPFQGKVACQEIFFGKGVCGTAASSSETQLVPNVHEYANHIACDGETKSEIVVPIKHNGKVVGVIDLDCLDFSGFDEIDKLYLEQLAEAIASSCDWEKYI